MADEERKPETVAEKLEERSERLGEDIEEAKEDWEAKKQSTTTPGAQPAEEENPLTEPGGPA